jgi:hypothetical protein
MTRTILTAAALVATAGISGAIAYRAGSAAGNGGLTAASYSPKDELAKHAQDAKKGVKDAVTDATKAVTDPQATPDDMQQMMEQWMAMGQPGEHHAKLTKSVGEWSVSSEFQGMAPGEPPMKSTGRMVAKPILGGRFVHSEFHLDELMGQPFDGVGIMGYDNAKQQMVSVWLDSMTTGIIQMTGSTSEDGTVTMEGMSGMGTPMKIETTWDGKDSFTDHFYDQMPDGSWVNTGNITYTRK